MIAKKRKILSVIANAIFYVILVASSICTLYFMIKTVQLKGKSETLYAVTVKDAAGNCIVSEEDCTYIESNQTRIYLKKNEATRTIYLPQDELISVEKTQYKKDELAVKQLKNYYRAAFIGMASTMFSLIGFRCTYDYAYKTEKESNTNVR